jgi:Na+(H+)/acetate symporter ActP
MLALTTSLVPAIPIIPITIISVIVHIAFSIPISINASLLLLSIYDNHTTGRFPIAMTEETIDVAVKPLHVRFLRFGCDWP